MTYECSNCGHESGSNTGPCDGCKLRAPRRIQVTEADCTRIGPGDYFAPIRGARKDDEITVGPVDADENGQVRIMLFVGHSPN